MNHGKDLGLPRVLAMCIMNVHGCILIGRNFHAHPIRLQALHISKVLHMVVDVGGFFDRRSTIIVLPFLFQAARIYHGCCN